MINVTACAWVAKKEKAEFSFDEEIFEKSKEETILGVTIDNKLTFYNHIAKRLPIKSRHYQEFHLT